MLLQIPAPQAGMTKERAGMTHERGRGGKRRDGETRRAWR